MSTLRCALFLVLVAGCMTTPTGETVEELKGTGKCMPNVCGTHTQALVECTYFWELSSDGVPNDRGVRMVSAQRADGTAMRIVAVDDHLRGVHPVTGATLAEHLQLEGTVIVLIAGTTTRTVTIEHVSYDHFWVGTRPRVEVYDLAYTPEGGGAVQHVTTSAYTGDRFDPLSKVISVGPSTNGWINFACKDTARYRQHLIGYTEAAQSRLGVSTTLLQRQGLFNAWTGNACGTGRTWSEDAEPLTLSQSHLSTTLLSAAPATYEAIWDAGGAVCMNIPRLATTMDQVTQTLSWMALECGAPVQPCTPEMIANWPLYGDAITGNPTGSTP